MVKHGGEKPKKLVKAVSNPIKDIYVEGTGRNFLDSPTEMFKVYVTVKIGKGFCRRPTYVTLEQSANWNKDDANQLRQELLKAFGIKIIQFNSRLRKKVVKE